jgi:DNA-binding transcriptional LysR family regulator
MELAAAGNVLFRNNVCAHNAQMDSLRYAEHLAVFAAVCRLGSFSAVAREKGVAHTSVVRQIDALEAELGVKLLVRSTRGLTPTGAGQLLRWRSQLILNDLIDLRAEVAALDGSVRGVLRIASLPTFGRRYVLPALDALCRRYPGLRAELDLTERMADPVSERLDVVIRAGQLADSGLIATKLATHRRRLVASTDYLERFGQPQSVADLANHRLLDKMHGADVLGWSSLLGRPAQQFAEECGVFRCDDFEALCTAATSGLGIGLLPSWVVGEHIAAGRLMALLPQFVDACGDAGGVYALRALASAPAKVSAFIAALQDVIGKPPVWERA